jgi:PST family polysaccharide transporter
MGVVGSETGKPDRAESGMSVPVPGWGMRKPPQTDTGDRGPRVPWLRVVIFQGIGLAVPLAILRVLAHTLGVDEYGRYAFATALAQYCAAITAWGFLAYGPIRVAAATDVASRSEYVSGALTGKALIAGVVAVLLAIVPPLAGLSMPPGWLLVVGPTVVGAILDTSFAYVGMNRLLSFLVIQAAVRLLSVWAVFALVRGATDRESALLINGVSSLAVSVLLLLNLRWSGQIAPARVSISSGLCEIRQAGLLSAASFASSVYTTLTAVLVGALVSPAELASFQVSYSVVKMTQAVGTPISQVMTPRWVVALSGADRQGRQVHLLRRFLGLQVVFSCVAVLMLWVAAPPLLSLIVGSTFEHIGRNLFILAPVILFGGLSTLIGSSILVPMGRHAFVTAVVVGWSILSVPLIAGGTRAFGVQGGAVAVLVVELGICASFGLSLRGIHYRDVK